MQTFLLVTMLTVFVPMAHGAAKAKTPTLKYGGFTVNTSSARAKLASTPATLSRAYPYMVRDMAVNQFGIFSVTQMPNKNCEHELPVLKAAKKSGSITGDLKISERKSNGLKICEYSYRTRAGQIFQQVFHRQNKPLVLTLTFADRVASEKSLRELASMVVVK